MADIDNDIFSLVARYGFKRLHCRLNEIMLQEYEYLRDHFLVEPVVMPVIQQVQAPVTTESKISKPRKQRNKKIPLKETKLQVESVQEDEVNLSLENPEIKDVIVTPSDRPVFRDPREVKEFQRRAEEAKRKENEAAGIQLFEILTKENLKKWVEEEGNTYAWVAREKAGCADTQVAATAQMMGIKSKISKKRGMIMVGR